MKIINSSEWTDAFVRRMVAWCARQVDYPVRLIREVKVRNRTRGAYSGHAYSSHRIVASVGPASCFPTRPDKRPGMFNEVLSDRVECLVLIIAHELTHLHQYANGRMKKLSLSGGVESDARRHSVDALRAFRENRDQLLLAWNAASATPVKATPNVQELRAEKAATMLSLWQKKAKLAQSKVRKYQKQVKYYNRQFELAATKTPSADAPLSSSHGKTE